MVSFNIASFSYSIGKKIIIGVTSISSIVNEVKYFFSNKYFFLDIGVYLYPCSLSPFGSLIFFLLIFLYIHPYLPYDTINTIFSFVVFHFILVCLGYRITFFVLYCGAGAF